MMRVEGVIMEADQIELEELLRQIADSDKTALLDIARDLLKKQDQADTQPIVPAS